MQSEQAELIAIKAMGWLIPNEDLLSIFLSSSGLSAENLRHFAGEVEILVAVLDFLVMDDSWVLDCAHDLGIPPQSFLAARHALPGGREMHWT